MASSPILGNSYYANNYDMVRKDSFNQFSSSEITNNEYTLADVYEDAAIIGSQLEKIINNYGSDILKDLMPKVISVLELLETMTINKEKENDQVNELKMRINSLEMEKTARNNEREKFEKELEEIDEKWKQETYRLIGMINKLKDENRRLNESLDQNRNIESKQNELLVIKQEELDYIKQIKEENIRLKETVRLKDREIEQKNSENEGLISQIDRLNSTMLSLRRKQILAQNQIEKMVKSKAEIECTLTEKEHQLNLIREKLKIKNLSEIIDKKDTDSTDRDTEITNSQEKLSKDLTNLLIFDANDPNRPRFTLRELQKVLREKNELTIKLDQTQDELEQLKNHDLNVGEVQGPINREPEEKLDPSQKQSQSGIRRLYVADSNNILVVVDLLYTNLYAPIVHYTEDSLNDKKQPEYRSTLVLANLGIIALIFNTIYIYFCFNNFFNFFIPISKLILLISRLVYKQNIILISSIGFFSLMNIKFSILADKYLFRFFKFKTYLVWRNFW